MIRADFDQGSAAWVEARLGLPTASQFHRIITPTTMKPSASAVGYRHELLAEWLMGEPLEVMDEGFMERGMMLEDGARRFYEMMRETDVERVGFLWREDRRCGCSPDGLVGDRGGVEIKCPSPGIHVSYLLGGPGDKYRAQIQGCLWIAERDWWDFLSYHPTMPPALIRVERDEPFIAALADAVTRFCDELDAAKADLLARGITPAENPKREVPPFFVGVG